MDVRVEDKGSSSGREDGMRWKELEKINRPKINSMCFIDFRKKSFDGEVHERLWIILEGMGYFLT